MTVQDLVLSVFIGVLTGLATSVLWLVVLYQFRPKIDISKYIRKASIDKTFQIKVINRHKREALNVKAQLHLMPPKKRAGGDEFTNAIPIPLKRSELMQLSGRDRRHKGAAVFRFVIALDTDLETLMKNNPDSYLAFRLFATHPVTQFGRLFKQNYPPGEIKEGDYSAVDSLEIV